MQAAEIQARLDAALKEVRQAGALLIRPEPQTVEQCRMALARGISHMQEFSGQEFGADSDLFGLARQVQAALRETAYLLQTASDYHGKWFRVLRAHVTGYTPAGDPGDFSRAPRVVLQG